MKGMSSGAREKIEGAVDTLFDRMMYRLLGPFGRKKTILFSSKGENTLAHLFVQALRNKEPNSAERDMLKGLLSTAKGYIDALKERTKSNVIDKLDSKIKSGKTIGREDIGKIVSGEMGKSKAHMKLISEAESTKVRNSGVALDILKVGASIGTSDPYCGFIVVHDSSTCVFCIKNHLLDDGVTPRIFKFSEIQHGYLTQENRKAGDVSTCGQHPHCFVGDQYLYTSNGLEKIENLFKEKKPNLVLVDYRIVPRKFPANQFGKTVPGSPRFDNHSTISSRFLEASPVYETGIQECLKIILNSGQEMTVSTGHETWVQTGNTKYEKKQAKDLVIGDRVPLIYKNETFGEDHFPESAELMGNLLGDGTLIESNNTAQFRFFGEEIEYGTKMYELVGELTNRDGFHPTPKIYLPNDKYSVPRMSFNSQRFGRLIKENFDFSSKKPRKVPQRLFKSDKETVAAFLRGLYSADGHSEPNGACLAQNDLNFLKEVQLLLTMFGFTSSIFTHGEAISKTITYNDGRAFDTNRKPCWRLCLSGFEQYNRFIKDIGFGPKIKIDRSIKNLHPHDNPKRHALQSTSIQEIVPMGRQQTYCLTEPMTNSLTVNGIVTGNCRCSLFLLSPGFGFKNGKLAWIGIGHNEYDRQRGLSTKNK